MALTDLPTRLHRTTALLPTLESALGSFLGSADTHPFRIIRTVHPTSSSPPSSSSPSPRRRDPKTLYILDSSFNPPTRAHLSLATSALLHPGASDDAPRRLLLLFSTHNADKRAASSASAAQQRRQFADRLAMMTLLAEEVLARVADALLQREDTPAGLDAAGGGAEVAAGVLRGAGAQPEVDVGLTSRPLFCDKSAAIEEAGSGEPSPSPEPALEPSRSGEETERRREDGKRKRHRGYGSDPSHVHLVGYDTFTRLLTPRYYASTHSPPLDALAGYFGAGHRVRITQRAPGGGSANWNGGDEEDERTQEEYVGRLREGELEQEGFKREWAGALEMVPGREGMGVSSTRVREAAEKGEWDVVDGLCGKAVGGWIRERGVYNAEGEG